MPIELMVDRWVGYLFRGAGTLLRQFAPPRLKPWATHPPRLKPWATHPPQLKPWATHPPRLKPWATHPRPWGTHQIMKPLLATIAIVLATALLTEPVQAQADLRTYQLKYYILHTDLEPEDVQGMTRRLTLMAEEFHARTRGFTGAVQKRLPIYMFSRPVDYYAAGGARGTAGVYTGDRLMVLAGAELARWSWHVIQHEAFHQFADAAIGRDLLPWANEGLAEYFGHGVFTGDNFYTGFIPPERLARIKKAIREKEYRPLIEMMRLRQELWNTEIGLAHHRASLNYDQAWAMVHFLAHANNGRYQDAFGDFLRAVSHRQQWEQAWRRNFGNDINAFQQRWEEYWLGLPDRPTEELEAQAIVATVTSYYARALSQRQRFEMFEEFVAAAEAGRLKFHEDDRLPAALLEGALAAWPEIGTWSLRLRGKPAVVCVRADGTIIEGRFRLRNHRVKSVEVLVKPPKRKWK